MALEQALLRRPLSRLELALAVAIIATVVGVGLHRLLVLAAVAEATALDLTIRNLRTGILSAVAVQYARGDLDGIALLAAQNPVGALMAPPSGYIGPLRQADAENVRPGQWYYDEEQHWLVYHIVNADYLDYPGEGPARVRLKLRVHYNASPQRGGSKAPKPAGIALDVLDPLHWKF
jgi:hypothetical protein